MNYSGITAPDIANGTGCRVVLWLSGCSHHCKGCHNQETWDYNHGTKFDEKALAKIKQWLSKPYIKGITLSGGDPLDRNCEELQEVLNLCNLIKSEYPNKDIWIYTGYTLEQILNDKTDKANLQKQIIMSCDYLVDGPYMEHLRDLSIAFRGSTNQRIINIKENKHSIEKW